MALFVLLILLVLSIVYFLRTLFDAIDQMRRWWHQAIGSNGYYEPNLSNNMETEPQVKVDGDYIRVESGATMVKVAQGGTNNIYYGAQPQVRKEPPLSAIKRSLKVLIDNRVLTRKQDFGITYEIDLELHVYPFDGYSNYVKVLSEWTDVIPEELMPSPSNIKCWNFGSDDYPRWNYEKPEKSVMSHVQSIAEAYIDAMAEVGWVHACRKPSER